MNDLTKSGVIEEYKQLCIRCKNVWSIIRSQKKISTIPKEQQNLLTAQLTTMIEYKEILKKRLQCWENE